MRRLASAILFIGLSTCTLGCGEDETIDPEPGLTAKSGIQILFDVEADLSQPASFYHLPYPLDVRLTDSGTPDLTGMPVPDSFIVSTEVPCVMDRPGFSAMAVAYFEVGGPVPPQVDTEPIPADPSSPLLLVDIDPDSPDRGTLYPTLAYTPAADDYTPQDLLAVTAFHGIMLVPGRTYAFVVQRSLNDAGGNPLGVPLSIVQLAAGGTPAGALGEAVATLYEPLWETLDQIGVDREEVASAAVFTPGDVVEETFAQSEAVLADHSVDVEDLALDPDDGTAHPRFCELHGTVTMPQFQLGESPFTTEGNIELDSDGAPIKQTDEAIPIAITIPKGEMPADGYPVVLYIHGSGGLSTQLVDRGKTETEGGEPIKGEGPAHVVAEHGFAAIGAAMPVNPERVPGVGSYDYINFSNPGAFPYTFRQGLFEQRLLIAALGELTIDPAALTGCDGPTLPSGQTTFRFDVEPLFTMGQSMGGIYTTLLAAVEPRIEAIAPTGAGSWNLLIMESQLYGSLKPLASALLDIPEDNLSFLHPGIHLLQTCWGPAETLVSAPRVARRPIDGHPVRHIYETMAPNDEYFSTQNYNSVAMAFGNQQAGEEVWPEIQDGLALVGTDGIASFPVSDNVESVDGTAHTGVLVQYEGDGILNPHEIFTQYDEIKYQYGCFFASYQQTGTAVVPAPAALGTPCP
ncbi:MAG: hypothetical protein JRI68_16910 [Deltaproteobacteria bacterium]|nr:hypothetical protein [Deltaproteobacteria bacterium]